MDVTRNFIGQGKITTFVNQCKQTILFNLGWLADFEINCKLEEHNVRLFIEKKIKPKIWVGYISIPLHILKVNLFYSLIIL